MKTKKDTKDTLSVSGTSMTFLTPKNSVELLLFNSHDRSTAFSISAGIYRFVCANGLVIADSVFESYKIKHIGDRDNDVLTSINNITAFKPQLESKIHILKSIELSKAEKQSFAKSTLPLRFEEHIVRLNKNSTVVI